MSKLYEFVIATQAFEALGFGSDTALALASGDMVWLQAVQPFDWLWNASKIAGVEPHYFWLALYYDWCVAVPW